MNEGQSYEYRAKTVEAAVNEGLRQLGVSRDDIEIEVIDEGSRGILGIGASDAHVRLTRRIEDLPLAAQAEEASTVSELTASVAETVPEYETPGELESTTADDPGPVEDDVAPISAADSDSAANVEEDEGDAELEDLAFDLLNQMLVHLGIEAEIEVSWQDNPEDSDRALCLNVVGEESGVLIGRNGETLASMQYLIRLMVNQEIHRWKNIVVDIDGYKQRRAEQLSQLAHRLAEQVVASGRPASLEPMPASERRLVHIALRDHEHVYTSSTGEDTRRKVQILLK
ncbi:MAG: Jag N-terminal domain-containing protein [Caldilineaceae bacterium]|nr:Jag N-terminal domain-containing protein [Caldilineaceae bacterium]